MQIEAEPRTACFSVGLGLPSSSDFRDRFASGGLEFLVAPCRDSDHDPQAEMITTNTPSLHHVAADAEIGLEP